MIYEFVTRSDITLTDVEGSVIRLGFDLLSIEPQLSLDQKTPTGRYRVKLRIPDHSLKKEENAKRAGS
jgi:hypothetical protein